MRTFFLAISLLVISILLSNGLSISFTSGQAQRDRGFDWSHSAYDVRATNFNPQNQINKETITRLTDDWSSAFIIPAPVPGIVLQHGIRARPIVQDGIIYLTSNFLDVFAFRAETGAGLWFYAFPINMTQVVLDTPEISPFQSGEVEGATMFEGNIIMPTPDCGVVFLEGLSGVPRFVGQLTSGQMCSNVQGNEGRYTGQMLFSPVVYERGRVLITGTGVSGRVESGRGFIAGFNVDTGELIWRFFLMPPAGGDPNWAMQFAGKGNVNPTRGDWGDARGVGVGVGWGQWAIDEETGIVYVGTSPPAPSFNATNRPGPNLFSSSILALDAMTGELKWYYQVSPHDLYGFGCLWNTALGNIGSRKVLFKACDNGRLLALDAATGQLIWSFLPPSVKYVNVEDPFVKVPALNKRWATEPSNEPHWQCPGITGATGGDIAIGYGRVYYAAVNFCDYLSYSPVERSMSMSNGAEFLEPPFDMPRNTTIFALNAQTGNMEWTFTLPSHPHRGGLVASGNMVIFSSLDGKVYTIDADTGEEVFTKFFGAPMGTSPTIAATAAGAQQFYQVIGGIPERFSITVSGLIVTLKVRGGVQIPINGDNAPPVVPPSRSMDIPLTIVLPAIAIIAVVFVVAAFGRRTRTGPKKEAVPSTEAPGTG